MGAVLSLFHQKMSEEDVEKAVSKAKEMLNSTPVMIFSKTSCGYCMRVKNLFSELGATYKVLELDQERDGPDIQSALLKWTGQRTVPNVFIGGKHIGGCDDVTAKHQRGELVTLLIEAGAMPKKTVQLQ